MSSLTLEQLWAQPTAPARTFTRELASTLPAPARRYLEHAIAPGARLATRVRVRMHGHIKLKRWLPFTAEHTAHWDHGFVWRANVRMGLLPLRGFDRYVDGDGEMDWRLLGCLPVMRGHGPDVARSAAGRFAAEAWLLPGALCGPGVHWTSPSDSRASAQFEVHGRPFSVEFAVAPDGQLLVCHSRRWGNPRGGEFAEHDFGGSFAMDRTFGDYTIPTNLSAGWHFGSPTFAEDGEFFRATIDDAEFR